MNFLQSRLGPFPVWVWGLVVIGGVVVFFIVKRMQSGSTTSGGSTLGQNTSGQVSPLNPGNDPNIDPNTGVPYQIEEAIDPNSGLPYYFLLTNGATTPGQAGGGVNGATASVGATGAMPPQPQPSMGPGTAPGTAPAGVAPRGGNAGSDLQRHVAPPGPQPGVHPQLMKPPPRTGVKPPQPQPARPSSPAYHPGYGAQGTGLPTEREAVGTGVGEGAMPPVPQFLRGAMPPVRQRGGTGDGGSPGEGVEWDYPFWAGQGGLLYAEPRR